MVKHCYCLAFLFSDVHPGIVSWAGFEYKWGVRTLLIGHRGAGKTSLLQRYQIYLSMRGSKTQVFDLDREVERHTNLSCQEIFAKLGEAHFRKLELEVFSKLVKGCPDFVIALGAGFSLETITDQVKDQGFEIIWIRRPSDSGGRIFLEERPALNQGLSSLTEYQERFEFRESLYSRFAHKVYLLPEGLSAPTELERKILFGETKKIGGILTLQTEHFKNWPAFLQERLTWGLDAFEIRNDLLDEDQIRSAIKDIPPQALLFSFRKSLNFDLPENIKVDWPVELGLTSRKTNIASVHQRNKFENLEQVIERLHQQKADHYKLAVSIQDWVELQEGLRWQQHDPKKRSFLPRSENGRWKWVRQWLKLRQQLNFLNDGMQPVKDQPSLFEWLSTPPLPQHFGAVLGEPVDHSYSPSEHLVFSSQRGHVFFAIELRPEDFVQAWPLLNHLGLRFAAVTSPLKKIAFEMCSELSDKARLCASVNTLVLQNEQWLGDNTDLEGFESLLSQKSDFGPTAIWGGGGTLAMIRTVLPEAVPFSASRAKTRDGSPWISPETLIWAAPPQANMPPAEWKPKRVIDLNYRLDSLARQYAKSLGAQYVSGLSMFKVQAQAQQDFWEKYL